MYAEVLEEAAAKECVKQEPNLLKVHENAVNMAIIKLTVKSLVHENFKEGSHIIEFN